MSKRKVSQRRFCGWTLNRNKKFIFFVSYLTRAEVQNVTGFEEVLNGFRTDGGFSIFIICKWNIKSLTDALIKKGMRITRPTVTRPCINIIDHMMASKLFLIIQTEKFLFFSAWIYDTMIASVLWDEVF